MPEHGEAFLPCCLCGKTTAGGWTGLAEHVCTEHRDIVARASGRKLDVTHASGSGGYVWCWCGYPASLYGGFGEHLRACGGLEQHLLSVALGLPNERGK